MCRRHKFLGISRSILLALILVGVQQLAGVSASAQLVQVTNIVGASNFSLGNATTSAAIYGGIAGPIPPVPNTGCAAVDGVTPCNNCAYAPTAGAELACNTKRIYQGLTLSISFQVTGTVTPVSGIQPKAYLAYVPTGGTTTTIPNAHTSGIALAQGSTDTITIAWTDLCNALTQDPNCNTITGITAYAPQNIYIAIDANNPPTFATGTTQLIQVGILTPQFPAADANTNNIMEGCFTASSTSLSPSFGFCNFYARAGDEKVYIENPAPNISCNTAFTGVRVYYMPDDGNNTFQTASYGGPLSKDLQLDGTCSPSGDWSINGLDNGTGYFFRISMLDIALNNSFLLSATDAAGGGIMDQGSCPAPVVPGTPPLYNFATDAACGQYATPGKVVGILPNTLNCFIASAAYGSPLAPAVVILRHFRDEFLIPYNLGKKFVRYYYEVSPRMAYFVRTTPWLKTSVQITLAPVWAAAWFMLIYGPLGTLLTLIGTLVLIIMQMKELRRGRE